MIREFGKLFCVTRNIGLIKPILFKQTDTLSGARLRRARRIGVAEVGTAEQSARSRSARPGPLGRFKIVETADVQNLGVDIDAGLAIGREKQAAIRPAASPI
jgi:hypothetical protein